MDGGPLHMPGEEKHWGDAPGIWADMAAHWFWALRSARQEGFLPRPAQPGFPVDGVGQHLAAGEIGAAFQALAEALDHPDRAPVSPG